MLEKLQSLKMGEAQVIQHTVTSHSITYFVSRQRTDSDAASVFGEDSRAYTVVFESRTSPSNLSERGTY
jgi:hypothetical protein